MTTAEKDLIEQAQRGDREAFGRLVETYYGTAFSFACKYCGNRQDAEDATQQAFVKLARSLAQYRHDAAFTSWLYRLVINCARDLYKRQRPETRDVLPETAGPGNAESSVMLEQVLSVVDSMGAGFRDTLALVIGEGLSHAEAADILAVKESTVSWRLHEIRKRLKVEEQPGVAR